MSFDENAGASMMELAKMLWPLNRSLSGEGVRETLSFIQKEIPALDILSIESGERVFDWTVPEEWAASEAYILDPSGERICDFKANNLHLVGYSAPFEGVLELEELQEHLYSLPAQPDAIPYVTSYYKKSWGFCLSQKVRDSLEPGLYNVVVRTRLFAGELNYGELVIKGKSSREVFFSTYICHPSMANNELSGPVLATRLADTLIHRDNYYTYRFVFLPETIGSLIYMSRNLKQMQLKMLAGFVLTCVGDERSWSFLPSRNQNTVADRAALKVLRNHGAHFTRYSWLDRGSDERQYCSPGADLPVCSVMRTKYGEYQEYHTSLDTLGRVVTERGLQESFEMYLSIIAQLEAQRFPKALQVGEPQLGKRNLWPSLSIKDVYSSFKPLADALSLMDGETETAEIAAVLNLTPSEMSQIVVRLEDEGLVEQ
jgi:aminopeptidase-like protein